MSASDLARPAASRRELWGWGRAVRSSAAVLTPEHPGQVELRSGRGDGLLARGAGCSYGDAAQLEGGTVIDTTGLRRILWVDSARRLSARRRARRSRA